MKFATSNFSGALFQRLQIGDNVLPVFLVRHRVDHLRALDKLAGALEPFIQACFIPGDVLPLQCRRIAKAGLRSGLAADDAGQGRSEFVFTRLGRMAGGAMDEHLFPAAASLSAFAVIGTESVPADASLIT